MQRIQAAFREFDERRKTAPPVSRPERFDFLIGLDDEGRKFPVAGEDDERGHSGRQ